ncbi:MAG: helix-turn-helix transcriptional regulator [Clostridiales bacterium]|nr:helix-turn-helix transcriptional regulator [Clostridiales bacterium]
MKERYACEGNIVHEAAVNQVSGQMLTGEVFSEGAQFFKVMGDGTRFKILWALDKHELCVCDLAHLLGMSKSAVSHQLARLRENRLVKNRREGKNVFYTIADDHVHRMLISCVEHVLEPQD